MDSALAKKLAENPEFHKRIKHIEILYHYTRQAISDGYISILQIPSREEVADILTKNIPLELYTKFKKDLNLGGPPI